ncbi:MAG: TerD family protein [Rothia sp. (in: high G+C Gram-positive bacteria)]|uniref:TerD family protein n=1 Tax=Rothia sp. (in: high G+C Gram-positive bacteria) TaxID=1885016 RepID=UPI0026DF8712|nr:TerD family protein [Rothia sp. (in: high G+C Gram-positive bacteria)]MDO5751166.1 TerD family protein [Rothia sp. (in: high G+C Gram-positive bacteria)]
MIELKLGENLNLNAEAPGLSHVLIGIQMRTSEPMLQDYLESGVVLTRGGALVRDEDFVFEHQVVDSSASVYRREYMEQDTVQYMVSLNDVPEDIDSLEILIFVNGTDAIRLNRLDSLRVRLLNPVDGRTLLTTPLLQTGRSAVLRCLQLYRHRGDWKIRAVQDEWDSLQAMMKGFGR